MGTPCNAEGIACQNDTWQQCVKMHSVWPSSFTPRNLSFVHNNPHRQKLPVEECSLQHYLQKMENKWNVLIHRAQWNEFRYLFSMEHWVVSFKKWETGASVVAWRVQLPPAMQASRVGVASRPGCSTSYPDPCWWNRRSNRGCPSYLGPCYHLDGVPSCWLQPGPTLAIADIWGVNQQRKYLSLCLSLSLTNSSN